MQDEFVYCAVDKWRLAEEQEDLNSIHEASYFFPVSLFFLELFVRLLSTIKHYDG